MGKKNKGGRKQVVVSAGQDINSFNEEVKVSQDAAEN